MKILLFDLETAPILSYIWGLWTENNSMDFVIRDWYILSYAAKWFGNKKMTCKGLCDYDLYKKNPEDDKELVVELWELLNEADVVIAHNALKFDVKKLNARFIYHGMTPPSPYKVLDTLKEAKKYFKFTSNRLDALGQFLKVGKKLPTGGFQLWKDVLAGKVSAWKKMKKYNKQDVALLEKVYLKIRSFIVNHPNVGLYNDSTKPCCPKCGSDKIIWRGTYVSFATKYRRIFCKHCKGWSRTRIIVLDPEVKKNLIVNAI